MTREATVAVASRTRKQRAVAAATLALLAIAGMTRLAAAQGANHSGGVTHDRDVNAARNMLSAGRSPPSVRGNESSFSAAPPSQTSRRCEARISALKTAA
jgi:hypothetical protein